MHTTLASLTRNDSFTSPQLTHPVMNPLAQLSNMFCVFRAVADKQRPAVRMGSELLGQLISPTWLVYSSSPSSCPSIHFLEPNIVDIQNL